MKFKHVLAAPLLIAGLLQAPAGQAGGLLGGLVNIGSGDTNSPALVDLNLGGGGGNLVNANVGNLVGADVNLGGGSGGASGNLLNANVGIGGGGVGVDIGLGLGGHNGSNGTNGQNGVNGTNGRNGGVVIVNRGGGGSTGIAGTGSARLKLLINVMENRAWLRFAQRNQLCLPAFGVAQVGNWLPAGDSRALPRLLDNYAYEIGTLQALLKNCRGNGRLGQIDLSRVIGLDQRRDGSLVLFVL